MLDATQKNWEGQARFGPGLRHRVDEEMGRMGLRRALILCTPRQSAGAQSIAAQLGAKAAGVFAKAAMHTPVHVTQEAMTYVTKRDVDCLVAIGGGWTIGLAKAIAYRTDLPQIAIPTTYAGSEATPILGQTENGKKTTLRDARVQPEVVLYDPELVQSLPVGVSVASALNAMAHAAEALYAPSRTPATDAMALEGFEAFAKGIKTVVAAPSDLDARLQTLRGAWSCGRVLGQVDMGLHHKLCHTLGGAFDLPHAQTHAIILPHAIAYNARSAPTELQPIADMLESDTPGRALYDFAREINAPRALRDIGLREQDLDSATALATQSPYPNPHPVTQTDIHALLKAAWAGAPPAF